MVALIIGIYLTIGFVLGLIVLSFIYQEEIWDNHITDDNEEIQKRKELREKFDGLPGHIVVPVIMVFFTLFWLPGMILK